MQNSGSRRDGKDVDQLLGRVAACRRTADSLIAWFWRDGSKRAGRYQLPVRWLSSVYRHRDVAAAADGSLARRAQTCAVWGPSQSGKSTLLSDFIDSPDSADSALCWPGGSPFRFRGSDEYENALNPYNTRGDASSCVTRFTASDHVDDPANPVTLTFATRRQMLQALAAGYLLECRLEYPGQARRDWDSAQIRALLNRDTPSQPTLQQEPVELLLDTVSVIDRLIDDEHPRYQKLRGSDTEWDQSLRETIIEDPVRASSLPRAEALAFELLWDGDDKLTALYRQLESYRVRLANRFGDRPVRISLKLASLLLDIDAYPVLKQRDSQDRKRSSELQRLLMGMRVRVEADRVLIDSQGAGTPLLDRIEDFGLFQALAWELTVPLRRDFVRGRSEQAANFLDTFDVLDVPGVARQYQKAKSQKLDLKKSDVTDTELLIQVIKRGKTATIISRHAEQMSIDALLLLLPGGAYPAQPAQLIGGVQAIWHAWNPDYRPEQGPPPVPVAVCLTMMSQLIDEMAAVGSEKFDMGKLDHMVADLGPIVHPNVRNMFTTTYPHLPVGRFQTSMEIIRARILPVIFDIQWFKERFRTQREKASLKAMLNDADGGVGYLLEAVASLISGSGRPGLENRIDALSESISASVLRALPVRDPKTDKYREVMLKLVSAIEHRVAQPGSRDQDVAQAVSYELRRAFSFGASDFKDYPESIGREIDLASTYLRAELDQWVTGRVDGRVLAKFDLDADEQAMVFDAVRKSVDVNLVAEWCVRTFGHVVDSQRAEHVRRYIAVKCASLAFEPRSKSAAEGDLNALCQAKFQEWSKAGRSGVSSPHYEAVIAPMLDVLRDTTAVGLAARWDDQAGDADIESLYAEWQTTRGGA